MALPILIPSWTIQFMTHSLMPPSQLQLPAEELHAAEPSSSQMTWLYSRADTASEQHASRLWGTWQRGQPCSQDAPIATGQLAFGQQSQPAGFEEHPGDTTAILLQGCHISLVPCCHPACVHLLNASTVNLQAGYGYCVICIAAGLRNHLTGQAHSARIECIARSSICHAWRCL